MFDNRGVWKLCYRQMRSKKQSHARGCDMCCFGLEHGVRWGATCHRHARPPCVPGGRSDSAGLRRGSGAWFGAKLASHQAHADERRQPVWKRSSDLLDGLEIPDFNQMETVDPDDSHDCSGVRSELETEKMPTRHTSKQN